MDSVCVVDTPSLATVGASQNTLSGSQKVSAFGGSTVDTLHYSKD